jgi:hypothetical protein
VNGTDAGGDGSTLATGVLLASGASKLIDVFVFSGGVIVVTADSVSVVDRTGAQLHMLTAPREITAAAFDGTTLAVADKAILTTYTTDLTQIAPATLTEACVGVAMVSAGRVLCSGPGNFPTKFYTFNAMTGALVLTSMVSGANGKPLVHVLGKDDLVSLDQSSSAFQLLRIDATSLVSTVGSSPFGHTYHASSVFAFSGNPANHIVTEDGIFANIYSAMCDKAFTTSAQCFVQDGVLGTLRGTEKFIALDGADGAGKVYALVDTPTTTFDSMHCVGGCSVERVDTMNRIVEAKKPYSLDLGQAVTARHDAVSNALVVGFVKPAPFSSTAPYPGFRVELLTYE